MTWYILKTLITAVVIVAVSELGKHYSAMAAILAALPITSVLALIWLYHDTSSVDKVSDLSTNIFFAVLPSLLFFLILPFLMKSGFRFWIAMGASLAILSLSYFGYLWILKKIGYEI